MLERHVLGAALAALLALPAAAQGPSAAPPPAGSDEPCEPVVPCELPDDGAGAPAEGPADLGAEARRLFDLVSCRGASPPAPDREAVVAFCAGQSRALAAYRDRLPAASAFLARLRPAGLPTTVVVPFTSDLGAALATYPELRNVTTVSPAAAGDPRRLASLRAAELRPALARIRAASDALLRSSGGDPAPPAAKGLPVQLAAFLTALAAHGYEPVGLRYFRIERDGALRYLTARELAATGPDAAAAFDSSELTFVKRGEDPRTRLRTHRHLAADLSDAALARRPGVLAHLAGKGEVAIAMRGGPHLLWRADHARVRDLLLRQAALIVSDATGPSPGDARAAGLVQEAHGAYRGTAGADRARDAELVSLFAAGPARPLPFRYGHLDRAGQPHLIVTRRPDGR